MLQSPKTQRNDPLSMRMEEKNSLAHFPWGTGLSKQVTPPPPHPSTREKNVQRGRGKKAQGRKKKFDGHHVHTCILRLVHPETAPAVSKNQIQVPSSRLAVGPLDRFENFNLVTTLEHDSTTTAAEVM